jgi:LPXTG-site transpeptidase (sortase) family protein
VSRSGVFLLACVVCLESADAQSAAERRLGAAERIGGERVVMPRNSAPPRAATLVRGSVLGRFQIPRLNLSFAVLEGTDDRTLDRSIGHVEWSARIGETGNIAIAGHRHTHFRKLEWLRRGDEIVLSSATGQYRYRVEWARLFRPTDIEVLDAAHGPSVTLITCFPFEYVGSAPLRFVVRALPDDESRSRLRHPGD